MSRILKVVIFGATGQTGRLLAERAVAHGHAVTVFARDPGSLSGPGGSVRVVRGDVLDAASVDHAVADQEAVLVALGTATRRGSPQVLPHGIRHILDAMERHGVRRIVVLSAAGARHEPHASEKSSRADRGSSRNRCSAASPSSSVATWPLVYGERT